MFGLSRLLAVATLPFFVLVAICPADEPPADPVHHAVERGLQSLQKESYRWKGERQCAACHHGQLTVWAFNEAKVRGYSVDEPILKEMTEWCVTKAKADSQSVQAPPRDVLAFGSVYSLLSLETLPLPNTSSETPPAPELGCLADRQMLVDHIVKKQVADGSWGMPMDERVPLGGPVEDIAILSRIVLLQSGDTSTTVTTTLQKAAEWLEANKGKTSRQERNFHLWMDKIEGKSPEALSPMIESIKDEQKSDGGWSQTPEMPSDAYATGQTLYILARCGVTPDDPGMKRGVDFLLHGQHEDGSWTMVSRVRSKNLTPITSAGAAWAVLGLLRASP